MVGCWKKRVTASLLLSTGVCLQVQCRSYHMVRCRPQALVTPDPSLKALAPTG